MKTNIIGESAALTDTLAHLSHLANINRPILVLGERGTGKELAAERLHFLSARWDAPFIKVNCAAMAETLLESEHFGTMSTRLQEKLLRLIEYGEFERVGGQKTIAVDVRVVAATNADLVTMVAQGQFRADLLDRLSFDVVHMPALRARASDIDLLAEHFAIAMSAELGWGVFPGFTDAVREQLAAHEWPGNVRELKNVVERSLHRWDNSAEPVAELIIDPFLAPGIDLENEGLAPAITAEPATPYDTEPNSVLTGSIDFRAEVEKFERSLLEESLRHFGFNQRLSAEQLTLSYDQLRGLVRKHNLRTRRRRKPN